MHLTQRFFNQEAKYQGKTCFASRGQAGWTTLSWNEVGSRVRAVMSGLRSRGIQPGDRVLLLAENRPEWAIFDLAIMGIGAYVVPAYTTHTKADLTHIFDLVTPVAAIASSTQLASRVVEASSGYPGLKYLWTEEPIDTPGDPGYAAQPWTELLDCAASDHELCEWDHDDTCALIFTSGTSGLPKAAMLTHRSIGANVDDALTILTEHNFGDQDRFLSFLPLAHAYEHTAGLHMPISMGSEIWFCESTDKLQQYLPEVKPSVATAVPRLYDLLYGRINAQLKSAPKSKQWLFNKTLTLGKKRVNGQKLSAIETLLDKLLDKLVRDKVRERFGGKIRYFISGGAALNPEVGEFFTSLGVGIIQGYGQTEASPLISVNKPSWIKIDSCGQPFDRTEIRLADDGELLVRGPSLMKGYWEDQKATDGTIRDGWLYTGDLATIDDDGFVRIVGRKKDLIVTSGGDNIAPSKLEAMLSSQPEIEQAVVFGDSRPWLGAVLVPSPEIVASELDKLRDDLQSAVDRVNTQLSVGERIRKFIIQEDICSTENGLLTPTQKIKRAVVLNRNSERISELY
jgi:long-chain acyl-CoA synthetase